MLRPARGLAWLAVALAALLAMALGGWSLRPVVPDTFYAAPDSVPAEPGKLLRQEGFGRQVPSGAIAWRMLYTTTDARGSPALASAIVMRARRESGGPRPVVAWAHGTTGVAPGCAPSLLAEPFHLLPALAPLLERGWLLVATDYAGLGTRGPHPYLIGEGEARSVLDAVRAARQMPQAQAGPQTVVWGHSQGGHAALWAGLRARGYAPDVEIAGVAAAAPASDLGALIDALHGAPIGRVMTAYVLQAYAATYPDVRWGDYVAGPLRRLAAQDMAGRCLVGGQAFHAAAVALVLGGSIFSTPPSDGALGARLAQNTPDGPLPMALLVAQGDTDDLVLPQVQAAWVARRCAAGQAIEFRLYPGRDHLTLLAPESPFTADLVRWTEARFFGQPASTNCPR